MIYGLTALAGVMVWNRIADRERRKRMMALFALNALLNVLWSELFFGQQRPDWALSEVVPFWLSVLVLVLLVFPINADWGLGVGAVSTLGVVRRVPEPGNRAFERAVQCLRRRTRR